MMLARILDRSNWDPRLLGLALLPFIILATACGPVELIAQRPVLLPTMAPNMDLATRLAPTATPTQVEIIPPTETPTARPTLPPTSTPSPLPTNTAIPTLTPTPAHPLDIERMRGASYPGSALTINRRLSSEPEFNRFIASYESEGSRIYALLTMPKGEAPAEGWPVIIFNHGYIPPRSYRTTGHYVDHVYNLARHGYVVFKPDYRGHDDSEGRPVSAYGSPGYTIDVLNGLEAVKNYPGVDPSRIGMMGHSMGGYITLRAMVISEEIKAGVIWGGVVASYADLLNHWGQRAGQEQNPESENSNDSGRPNMLDIYGTPEENPEFWASISATSFLDYLSGPIQLHHSTTDSVVPVEFSKDLNDLLLDKGIISHLYLYKGDNHGIYANFGTAMRRSIQFFDSYLKDDE